MSRTTSRGFTIIELLVVLFVIAILAAIAVPRLQQQKNKGIQATMVSDLSLLAKMQEGYYYTTGAYTTSLVALNLELSPGNSVVINEATTSGWSATMDHVPSIGRTCYIFYGNATPPGSATTEGVPSCS